MRLGPPPTRNRQRFPFVGTLQIPGLPQIRVETARGGIRSGIDPDGKPWRVTMPAHYGEFERSEGTDGDPVDVFVGNEPHAAFAYVVHAARADGSGAYDEDKVFAGFPTRDAVEATFRAAYNRPGLILGIRKLSIPQLAGWLADRDKRGQKITTGDAMKALQVAVVRFGEAGKALITHADLRRMAGGGVATPSEEAITATGPDEIDPFDGIGETEKGRVFLDEAKAQKAGQRVTEQYGATEADGERYWRLKAGIYKRMGGAFRGRSPEAGKAADDAPICGCGTKMQGCRCKKTAAHDGWACPGCGAHGSAEATKRTPADKRHHDRLPGGRADRMVPSDFDARALARGARHEREHTSDPGIAREIAMDHLAEDPAAYEHDAAKALEWVDLPEAVKAVSRRDNLTMSMFDLMAPPPPKPEPPKGPTHQGTAPAEPAQPGLFGNDPTHGGKLHQESRTDATGRTQTRWVGAPEAAAPTEASGAPLAPPSKPHVDQNPTREPAPEPAPAPPPEKPAETPPPVPEPLILPDPTTNPKGHALAVGRALAEGTFSADRLREEWARWKAADLYVKAYLNKLTVPELKRMTLFGNGYTKAQLVDRIHSGLSQQFHPSDTLSHWMTETAEQAIDRQIKSATDADLQKYADSKAEARRENEARKKAHAERQAEVDRQEAEADARAENPTTAEDYERRIAKKGRDSLTPEQKAEADELVALRDRGKREAARAAQEAAAAERRAAAAKDARPSRDLTPEELEARIEDFGKRVEHAERAYANAYETRSYGTTATARRLNEEGYANAGKELTRWRRRLEHARAVLAWKRGQDDDPGAEQGEAAAASQEPAQAGATAAGRATKGNPLVGTAMTLHAGVHTKKGHPIWTAEMHDRVGRDEYDRLNRAAKAAGGYYSSYRGGGAVPGFVFDDADAAHRFMAAHGGVAAAPAGGPDPATQAAEDGQEIEEAAPPEVEPEIPDEVTGHAARAAKLRDLAESQHSAAQGVLDQNRKTNTLRRAEMAAGIEGRARGAQFLANTTRNIADAMEAGTLKHLHGVSARRHVEEMEDALRAAHYDAVRERAKGRQDPRGWGSGNISEEEWHAPPSLDDIEHARSPHMRTRREDLRELVKQYEAMPPARRRGLKEAVEVARKHGLDYGARDRGDYIAVINDEDAEKLRPLVERLGRQKGYASHYASSVADDMQEARRWRRMGIHTAEELRAALREYHGLRGEKPKADRLKEMQRELVGTKIPGYFPTPPGLARQAVALADIRPGHRVLEPSAGSGHMAREIKAAHPDARLDTIEQVPRLQGYLKEQGFDVVHHDHMEHQAPGEYDRIVMNPPFEAGQDAEHIQHAYGKLKPGGRLVAIMSEGPFFRQDKKAQAFRDFMEQNGGTSQKLPDGSFAGADSDRTTGVATRMVVLNKPHADPLTMKRREYLQARGATRQDIEHIEGARPDSNGEPIRPGGDDHGHATAPDWGDRAANALREWHGARRKAGVGTGPEHHKAGPGPVRIFAVDFNRRA